MEFHTRPTEDANQLAGRTTIVRNGDDIGKSGIIRISHVVEDIDQVVCRTASGEYNDPASCDR